MPTLCFRECARRLILPLGIIFAISAFLPPAAFGQHTDAFDVLVVGDSHISGQGLREKNKFYSLVTDWLQRDVFAADRKVTLKVKAHAGSRLNLHEDEIEKMRVAGDDMDKFHYQEANLSSPSIRAQIDVARKEYQDPSAVDLVMLSGCITDVLVANIINPFYSEKKLRDRIQKFCGESMYGVIEHAAASFPNAEVVVVGYFPIASTKSDMKAIIRYFSNIVSLSPKLQFMLTNPVSRQALKGFRGKFAKRSRVWVAESNRAMREAVAKLNAGLERPRAVFVETPIAEETSFATKEPLLWDVGKDHLPNDETYAERKVECAKVFGELKHQHYGKLSTRMCELSSVAHPNVAGSKAYAEAIKERLKLNLLAKLKPQRTKTS